MINSDIQTFDGFLKEINLVEPGQIILYRGQSTEKSLLPAIARRNSKIDTTALEIEALEEFKLRASSYYRGPNLESDWDWLALSRHYRLKTRLLDWTTNPLIALWFAYYFESIENHVYVWRFNVPKNLIVTNKDKLGPFEGKTTKAFRPRILDRRLEIQSAWFTAHKYSTKDEMFVTLDSNKLYKGRVQRFAFDKTAKEATLKRLDSLGINYYTLFPGLDGISEYINWKNGL